MDFDKKTISLKKVENAVKDRIESNCRFKIDVIIVVNGQLQKIIRYKK